jgi:hypothetical protein
MRHTLSLLLLLGSGLGSVGCTPAVVVPDADRLRVTRELEGRRRWLRVAVFLGPFFGDRDKELLSDQPFSEIELLETPGGQTIAPPKAERVLPPGTPVVVKNVEFPTPWLIAGRVLLTPRYHPWVWLEVPGQERPAILVLPQRVASFDDVRAELERYLATFDPSRDLQSLSEGQRRAVEHKELLEGMGPTAVAMAWGYPERRIVDRPAGKEQWVWPGGRRRAWLEDERLVRFEAR